MAKKKAIRKRTPKAKAEEVVEEVVEQEEIVEDAEDEDLEDLEELEGEAEEEDLDEEAEEEDLDEEAEDEVNQEVVGKVGDTTKVVQKFFLKISGGTFCYKGEHYRKGDLVPIKEQEIPKAFRDCFEKKM